MPHMIVGPTLCDEGLLWGSQILEVVESEEMQCKLAG